MHFADYEQEGGRLSEGGWCVGVLRIGHDVGWRCAHQHRNRWEARNCAYQAECFARVAGFVPDLGPWRWDDVTTWSGTLRRRVAARHGRL